MGYYGTVIKALPWLLLITGIGSYHASDPSPALTRTIPTAHGPKLLAKSQLHTSPITPTLRALPTPRGRSVMRSAGSGAGVYGGVGSEKEQESRGRGWGGGIRIGFRRGPRRCLP